MEQPKETLEKIKTIKELSNNDKELFKVNNILDLYTINDKLLKIINKELEKETVPSKDILDTIQMSLIISAVLS